MLAEEVIAHIHAAFAPNPYPGDRFLQGTFEGCEPFEEVGAFVGKTDWAGLDAAMLDGHYCALPHPPRRRVRERSIGFCSAADCAARVD